MRNLPRALRERGLIGPLVVLICGLTGVWLFGELLSEVLEGDTRSFDETVLLALRVPGDLSQPLGPESLQEFMRDVSGLGGVGVLSLITLASVIFLGILRKYREASFLAVSVLLGTLISTGFKMAVARPRPDLVPHGAFVNTASFPSGHSMMSAVVYLTLAVMLARIHDQMPVRLFLLTLATALTLGVGVSRVYLGVHWPTDVLAGWILGASWAILCAGMARWLSVSGKLGPPAAPSED